MRLTMSDGEMRKFFMSKDVSAMLEFEMVGNADHSIAFN